MSRDAEHPEPAQAHMSFGDQCDTRQKICLAMSRLRRAVEKHKPTAVIGLFSGGHDSFSACYVGSQCKELFTGVAHINTGIGIEATRDYVRKTCMDRGWWLIELKASENTDGKGQPDPQVYEDLVAEFGFPGPGHHGKMYNRLKERAIRRLERMFRANCRGKTKSRIMLVSGCRSQESVRRMGNVKPIQVDGRRIWCAPIHDWSKLDTSNCLEFSGQPRNLVVDLIHKSGECLCGAMRDTNTAELEELNQFDITRPAYQEIMRIQAIVKPIHGWGWGEKPTKRFRPCKEKPGQLCWSCMK